ncbi:hypothetical protein, partial [Pseudomonas aeruginosa]|uniref:hypothetical protein n=1 Tax=Pseudomonas aeruginosa TaxID=287 RepID=UPI001C2DE7EB
MNTPEIKRESSSLLELIEALGETEWRKCVNSQFVNKERCSGQPIPDSGLSFSSATAGGNPSLN